MTLYEINLALEKALMESIDPETGEILDFSAVEALQMERDEKLENLALYVKNLTSEVAAIRDEEKALAERRKSKEARAERLKAYLAETLGGYTFETAKVKCSFRKSTAVNVTDPEGLLWYLESMGHVECIKHKEPEIVKAEVAKLLKAGKEMPGATLEERNNMSIK